MKRVTIAENRRCPKCGGRIKGVPKRTTAQDMAFEDALRKILL